MIFLFIPPLAWVQFLTLIGIISSKVSIVFDAGFATTPPPLIHKDVIG